MTVHLGTGTQPVYDERLEETFSFKRVTVNHHAEHSTRSHPAERSALLPCPLTMHGNGWTNAPSRKCRACQQHRTVKLPLPANRRFGKQTRPAQASS